MNLKQQIKTFACDTEQVTMCLALLKVGHEKGHAPEIIMERIITYALLTFLEVPIPPTGKN